MENTKTKREKLQEEYESKLARIDREEEFATKVGLPLEMFAHINYLGTTLFVDLDKERVESIPSILAKIIEAYPALNEMTEIDYKGKVLHYSGFVLSTNSNCKGKDEAHLDYETFDNTSIRITLPMEFFSEDVLERFKRSVTESEYVHFSGIAVKDMPKVHSKRLKAFENLAYYGGHYQHVTRKEGETDAYNHMVMFGCLPKA